MSNDLREVRDRAMCRSWRRGKFKGPGEEWTWCIEEVVVTVRGRKPGECGAPGASWRVHSISAPRLQELRSQTHCLPFDVDATWALGGI